MASRARAHAAFSSSNPKDSHNRGDTQTSQKSTNASCSQGLADLTDTASLTESRLDRLAASLVADEGTEDGEQQATDSMNLPGQPLLEELDALIEDVEPAADDDTAAMADTLPEPPRDTDESLESILRASGGGDDDDLFEEGVGQVSLSGQLRPAWLVGFGRAGAAGEEPAVARTNCLDFAGIWPAEDSSERGWSPSFASDRSGDFERLVAEVRMRDLSHGAADLLRQPLPLLQDGVTPRIPCMDFAEVGLLNVAPADDVASASDQGMGSNASSGSARTFVSRGTFTRNSSNGSGGGSASSGRAQQLSAALASVAGRAARAARAFRGSSAARG